MEDQEQVVIITDLLKEFKNVRDKIQNMIIDLEKIAVDIGKIFPDKLQTNYRWIFETKVKTVTELFKTLLDMRKEIGNSLKDEIELRRRIMKDTGSEGLEDLFDIRKLAKRVEEFQKSADRIKSLEPPESGVDIISDSENVVQ